MGRVWRPHGAPAEWRRSGCGWGGAIPELDEHFPEAGLGVGGVLPDERDHLAVAVGSLTACSASSSLPARTSSAAALDAMVSWFSPASSAPESFAAMAAVTSRRCRRCATALSMRLASALASCSRSTASSLARQHFLYLLPLPQGQGSLRPGLAIVVSTFAPRRTHPLYRDLLADATFHELLLAYDRDLADTARCAGCARCSGVVHSAPYWRKPRGRPCRLGREHDRRFSFCCAVDGCRSRATPPSLRFLGPKVSLPRSWC